TIIGRQSFQNAKHGWAIQLLSRTQPYCSCCVKKFLRGQSIVQNNSTVLIVVAVAMLDENRRILMHRRHRDSVHGGLWEFPGGKIEPGETPESALVREISEELGVELAENDLRPLNFASGSTAGPDS